MSTPQCVFPRPQFLLQPDSHLRWYANVHNRMEVCIGGETYYVAVAVPTGLFTFMKDVCDVPPEQEVTLAIDEDNSGDDPRYVLSLMTEGTLYDLWFYTRGNLPAWILNKDYRL